MTRKSLKEIAGSDRQIARFLERSVADQAKLAEVAKTAGSPVGLAERLHYAPNHLPKGRNISEAAQQAITACILG